MKRMIIRTNAPQPTLNPSGGVRQRGAVWAVVSAPPLSAHRRIRRGEKLRGGWEGLCLVVLLLLCCFAALSEAFNLPDTGQTKCYRGVSPYDEISCGNTGQDGAYNINPMSFTGNGATVTDNNTGLTWQREDDGAMRTWDEAGTYCASFGSDWRLPTKKELMSIVDYSIAYPGPTINPIFTNTKQSYYWSSTTFASNPGLAWIVFFGDGFVGSSHKSSLMYVRCVRGGQ